MKTWHPWITLSALLALAALPALAAGPGEVKFGETSFEVLEEAGTALIRVERSRGEDGAVSVDWATADGTATAGSDYMPASGTLSWADGESTDRMVEIPLLDDNEAEGVETVLLTLSNPTGGAALDSEKGTSVLRILASDGAPGGGDDGGGDDGGGDDGGGDDGGGDDGGGDDGGERAGRIKFDQRNFLALESGRFAVISVERSRGETGAVSVDYATEAGTAEAGSDFTPVSGTLSWGDGDESRKTFQVPLNDDGEQEPSESLRLVLSNPTGGAVLDPERSWALLTILDGDQGDDNGDDNSRPGVLKFDERGFQAIEGQTVAVIAVERSRGARGTVSVEFTTADGSATDGEDYSGVSEILTWGNGDRSRKLVEVPILEDGATEGNETVQLSLANPTGGAGLDPERGSSVLTILDNDGSTTACTDDSTTLCLESGRFQVQVDWRTRNGDSGVGQMIPQTDNSGLVWFFDDSNVEMLVKVLDACALRGFESYWVFFAATTNVDFTVTVTDTATGVTKEYMNPVGQAAAPVQDTLSFDTCP